VNENKWNGAKVHTKIHTKIINNSTMSNPLQAKRSYILQHEGMKPQMEIYKEDNIK
jgi:hypothetical protein